MLEQQKDTQMDRKQHHRVLDAEDHINYLIDEWHICPYSDGVDELFEVFKTCTGAYLKNHTLTTRIIITIIKDLRIFLNPHQNENLYHFTDRICDAILLKHEGMTSETQEKFNDYLQKCLLRVYTGV